MILLGLCGMTLSDHAKGGDRIPQQAAYTASAHEYRSRTILQIFYSLKDALDPDLALEDRFKAQHKYLADQKDAIMSDEHLHQAVQILIPSTISPAEEIKRLKAAIEVKEIKGTDLIEIVVRSGDNEFSRDLANQLTDGYLKTFNATAGGRVPILHQKAEVGVLDANQAKKVEQPGADQPATKPADKVPAKVQTPTSKNATK